MTRKSRRKLISQSPVNPRVERNPTNQQILESGGVIVEDYYSSSESEQPNQQDQEPRVELEIPLGVSPMAHRRNPNHHQQDQQARNIIPNNGEGEQERGQREQERRRTIREVVSRGVIHDPFVHAYPNLIADFEIKGPLIASLPHFAGLDSEDAYGHLHSVFLACTSTKPQGVDIDDVQLKVFHLTLDGKAKEWFRLLPQHDPDALTSWANLRKAFLEHYFTDDRTAELKKDIYAIRQDPSESFYEYWCRFQQLLAKIPHHQICDEELISYFHKGLMSNERGIIDATG